MRCLCGEKTRKTYLKERTIRREGREVIFTGVPAEVCPSCGETYFTPEVSAMMLRLGDVSPVRRIPFPSARPMSAKAVVQIRKDLDLSQARLSDLLGLSKTSVALWEQGRRRPDGPSRVLLRLFAALGRLGADTAPRAKRSRAG
ncbi:MAG: YgiT-type zinc finger protein [Armatimonadetes bacterium]|nr:YgiT-type zinc finger protein [Armatimonadota bacterium]